MNLGDDQRTQKNLRTLIWRNLENLCETSRILGNIGEPQHNRTGRTLAKPCDLWLLYITLATLNLEESGERQVTSANLKKPQRSVANPLRIRGNLSNLSERQRTSANLAEHWRTRENISEPWRTLENLNGLRQHHRNVRNRREPSRAVGYRRKTLETRRELWRTFCGSRITPSKRTEPQRTTEDLRELERP